MKVGVGLLLGLLGEGLGEEAPAQGIDCVGDAGLVGDDLLGAQGQAGGLLAGQGQRLVHGVGVEGLGAAHHRRQGLDGGADQVRLRLLGYEGDAGGLGVEAKPPGARVLGPEALPHLAGPDAAGGAELGHLLEEVVVAVEEER